VKKHVATGLALVAMGASVLACWALVPLDKLVEGNAVIVVGTVESIDVAPAPKEGAKQSTFDVAQIRVAKVLKNTLADVKIKVGDCLPLSMPSVNRRMRMSTDIQYKKGKSGVWLLERKDGTYWATYPGDYQAPEKEAEIAALIEKQAK